ncbi:MAG: hypothetical protein V7607_1723 [Solirubrobacteraceae bacterium]
MALVTRRVLTGGPALAQRTVFGNLTGLLIHGVAFGAGLSALLVASAAAYTVVKLGGAAYLIYLALRTLRAAGARSQLGAVACDRAGTPSGNDQGPSPTPSRHGSS